MEESNVLGDDLPLPPARLFERLAQISGYTWDPSIEPFHSVSLHVCAVSVSYTVMF